MPDQAKAISRSWRRYMRFSLRGLIVLVLVIGGGLGWIVREARIQRGAVAAIENAGGGVSYDWQWSNERSISGGKPWAPRWLVALIGVDYFGHVTRASFYNATDETLVSVGRLTRLERLDLEGTSIGDAGLAHLTGLTNLVSLYINNTQVSDAGLEHLKGLTTLEILALDYTKVTGKGMVHLKGLTRLSKLSLDHTQVTDAGLAQLNRLMNLEQLDLYGTRVTDAGLAHLKGLMSLSSLELPGPRSPILGFRI